MAGAAFQSAVRALFWTNIALGGVIFATAPAGLAPPAQNEASSTCAPKTDLYYSAFLVRYSLLLAVFSACLLISGIETQAGGEQNKDGGPATTPVGLRVMFLLAVALSAVGAALAGRLPSRCCR